MEFFLLLLTVPFFYVWGIISFIKYVSRKPTEQQTQNGSTNIIDRKSFLHSVIADLKKSAEHKPDLKVSELIKGYEEELKELAGDDSVLPASLMATPQKSESTEPKQFPAATGPTAHAAPSFQNWYKDNSINLLLYIGAFLIVVSASIYVGLETVPGASKGFLLSVLTLLFFASGLWFHGMPKIKNAGAAFAAIGALLIPISGLGWYNFVFQYTGVSMGVVWLATSLVGLFAYIVLAKYFKSTFYSYVTSFSTLSFSFAFINAQGLQDDFYILASIMSSILLLGVSIYFKENKTEDTEIFRQPFTLTANVVMPIAILYGLVLASEQTTFTLQSTLSVLLGCFYYTICYVYFRKAWYIFAAQLLLALGVIYFGNWQQIGTLNILYLLSALIYLDVYLVSYFMKRSLATETDIHTYLVVGKSALIFLYALSTVFNPVQQLFFAVLPIVFGILLVIIRKNLYFAGFSSLFLSIALQIGVQDVLGFSDRPYILGIVYSLSGIAWYLACLKFRTRERVVRIFGLSSAAYFLLGTVLINEMWSYQLANALAMSLVCFSAYMTFAKREFLYIGSTILAFAVWSAAEFFQFQDLPYITGMLYALFGAGWYYAAVRFKNRKEDIGALAYASVINFAMSMIILFTSEFTLYQLLLSLVIAYVFFNAATEFSNKELIYASNIFLALAVWTLLVFLDAKLEVYPLAFTMLSFIFYLIHAIFPNQHKELYRKSGLTGTIASTVLYGLYAYQNDYGYTGLFNLERNALISSYATLILYSFDAYSRGSSKMGYTASAIGLITYLWQINFIGIEETNYYTLAIGLYFFVLSYLQRKSKNQTNKQTFDFLGTGFLLVPTWLQSFGDQGMMHAVILGITGIGLLAFGITYTDKWYRYAGIAAIVLAVTSQSKWAIIGIAGLGFLGLALYLLIFRKEDNPPKQ